MSFEPIDYEGLLSKFRGLIADHGTFAECQLHEYAAQMSRRDPLEHERFALTACAV